MIDHIIESILSSLITEAEVLQKLPPIPPHTDTHSLLVVLFSSQHNIRVWALEIGVNVLSSLLHL